MLVPVGLVLDSGRRLVDCSFRVVSELLVLCNPHLIRAIDLSYLTYLTRMAWSSYPWQECWYIVREASENTLINDTEKEFGRECSYHCVSGCNCNIDNKYTAARIW